MPKPKNTKLSVFKGREAKLNRAIFQALTIKGPQTIYDIHKQVRSYRGLRYTRYASVNKRVKALEESGYVRKIGVKRTKAGFEATVYEPTARVYLVTLLAETGLDTLIDQLDNTDAFEILALLVQNINTKVPESE